MSIFGPYTTRVGVLQRSPHFIDLIVRNSPEASAYRLWLSRSVNDAYGTIANSGLTGTGGLAALEAQAKKTAQSRTIVRKGVGTVAEVIRDQTRFQFDVEDFIAPAAGPAIPLVPSDDEFLYARVQERRLATGAWLAVPGGAANNANEPYKGPILVIPTSSFFGRAAGVVALEGLAPAGSDCAAGSVPVYDPSMQKPPPMHIVMPRPMGSVTIYNREAAGGDNLLVTFGRGMPMIKVVPGGSVQPTGGGYALPGVSEFILAMEGAGNGCAFAIEGVIGHMG